MDKKEKWEELWDEYKSNIMLNVEELEGKWETQDKDYRKRLSEISDSSSEEYKQLKGEWKNLKKEFETERKKIEKYEGIAKNEAKIEKAKFERDAYKDLLNELLDARKKNEEIIERRTKLTEEAKKLDEELEELKYVEKHLRIALKNPISKPEDIERVSGLLENNMHKQEENQKAFSKNQIALKKELEIPIQPISEEEIEELQQGLDKYNKICELLVEGKNVGEIITNLDALKKAKEPEEEKKEEKTEEEKAEEEKAEEEKTEEEKAEEEKKEEEKSKEIKPVRTVGLGKKVSESKRKNQLDRKKIIIVAETGYVVYEEWKNGRRFSDMIDLDEVFSNKNLNKDLNKNIIEMLDKEKDGKYIKILKSKIKSMKLDPVILTTLSEWGEIKDLKEYIDIVFDKERDIKNLPFEYDVNLQGSPYNIKDKTLNRLNRTLLRDNKELGTDFPATPYLEVKKFLSKIPFVEKLAKSWIGTLPKTKHNKKPEGYGIAQGYKEILDISEGDDAKTAFSKLLNPNNPIYDSSRPVKNKLGNNNISKFKERENTK